MAGERLTYSALATAAVVALAGAPGGSALARARPDLVEAAVTVAQRTVLAGGRIRVTDRVRNDGGATAPLSTTGYYLAHRARLGSRVTGSLGSGASSRGAATLRVPGSVAPGRYRVLACADDRHRVRESNESNNCRAAASALAVTKPGADRTPPTFAGLELATTCIPGPVGGDRTGVYHLRWAPAHDDVTPASELVYDVYQATRPGGEIFSTPTYTTPAGAVSFTTPPLVADKTYYFVVRARDAAGNRDANRVERAGVNLCL
jgi:hypothetical protein